MTAKRHDSGSLAEDSFINSMDEATAISSYMEITVVEEDGGNDQQYQDMVLPKSMQGPSTPRKRCDTDESGFTLVLKPSLDRDVSGLTECLAPSPSMVKNTSSTPRKPSRAQRMDSVQNSKNNKKPSRAQRQESGFDLVVSNESKPMSTLTMMDFDGASPKGSSPTKPQQPSAEVQKKWLDRTRSVEEPILEEETKEEVPDRSKKLKKAKQQQASHFDLLVSNRSIPMSAVTMLDFQSSPKPHQLSASVQKKWLASIDTPIAEGTSEDVDLNKLREARDANKKQTTKKSAKTEPKQEKKKSSTKSKPETRKSGAGKAKVTKPTETKVITKPTVVKKQASAQSSESTKSTKRNSGTKKTFIAKISLAKPSRTKSQDSTQSGDSNSKSRSKKKKSIIGRKSLKEERDQPISPKKDTKSSKREEEPITPDTKKVVKRKSKKAESRQDDGLSPLKTKRSSEKRVSVSPKKRDSESSPKAASTKTTSRKSTNKKKVAPKRESGKNKRASATRREPPGTSVHEASLMINNRKVPAIPIKPSRITAPQTSDDSSSMMMSTTMTKSRYSAVDPDSEIVGDIGGSSKRSSLFGKLRRSIKGRTRST